MESFGWKQVKSTANASDNRASQSRGGTKALPNSRKIRPTLEQSIQRFDTEMPDPRTIDKDNDLDVVVEMVIKWMLAEFVPNSLTDKLKDPNGTTGSTKGTQS